MSTAATASSVLEKRKGPASPGALVSLPDNDDLLLEILLRLSPLPSSLPRASLVCKRWRRLLSDPAFLRRFRAHHRKPLMLGFFVMDFYNGNEPVFTPTLATPDCILPSRFSFPRRPGEWLQVLDCRHGFVLLMNREQLQAVVWDPITGSWSSIAFPPELKMDHKHPNMKFDLYNGAVLWDFRSSAFSVVMVLSNRLYKRAWACLYESGPAKWGDIVSTAVPSSTCLPRPSILVGKSLCWVLDRGRGGILEFNTEMQSLAVISMPEDADFTNCPSVQILRTVAGGLGFAILSQGKVQLWERITISDCGVTWVLQKTIELERLISPKPSMKTHLRLPMAVTGVDEVNNAIILWTAIGVYMIQLESMKFTILSNESDIRSYFPYTVFYTSGLDIGGEDERAEMLDDT